jgi:hypothetical protein
LSVVTRTPYFFCNASPRSARGPEATMACGSINFWFSNPAIIASAIAPAPTKAMVVLESMEVSVREV